MNRRPWQDSSVSGGETPSSALLILSVFTLTCLAAPWLLDPVRNAFIDLILAMSGSLAHVYFSTMGYGH